jgi:phosphotriesterase-related protein
MSHLITTLGPKCAEELGMILPHEHIFVDLRTPDKPGYGLGHAADVIALMGPEVAKIQALGVTALVECSAVGVGRRADILKAFSEATGFPLVAPTGIYREPWVPAWAHVASEDVLAQWMERELSEEIASTGIRAGWIKLSAGDDGITPIEAKILRAAARASLATGAVIGSHTIRGRVVADQLAIIERGGQTPQRFIWIHAQNEEDFGVNLAMARRGAWIEYDGIGGGKSDEFYVERILRMLDAGFGDQVLLSMDRGWYDPAQPGGGTPRPFTYLSEVFLPKLAAAGVDDATIRKLTCANPFRAFARPARQSGLAPA